MVQLHATSPHHHPCPSSLQALTVSPQTLLSTPRGSPPFRCLELSSQQHARHLASRPRSEPRIAGVSILLFSGRSFPFSYFLCLHFHLGTPAVPLSIPFLYLVIGLGTTPYHLHTRSVLVSNPLAWPRPTCAMQFQDHSFPLFPFACHCP